MLFGGGNLLFRGGRGGPDGYGTPSPTVAGGGAVDGAGEEKGEEASERSAEHGGAGADDANVDFEAGPEGCGGLVV